MNRSRMCVMMSQPDHQRPKRGIPPKHRLAAAVLFGGIVIFSVGSLLRADGLSDTNVETVQVSGIGPYSGPPGDNGTNPAFEIPGGGAGFLGRVGHIAGQTVGRNESITHIGLAPYLFHEESMLFGDLRMFRTNDGRTGGSAGLGLRHYLVEHDAILGVAGYYDNDDSRGTRFKQLGLSLEYLSRMFDVRANWYVPIDDTERILGSNIVSGSERFSDNLLLFDRRTDFGSAADGVDVMLSTPIPGEVPEMINLEVSAGGYHYQVRDSNITKMYGYKLRTDADLFKRVLHMFVELTSDRVTNTNVIFGASLNYYHGFESRRRLHGNQFYRMSEWVRRNYTVVTIDDSMITSGEVARNPETGDPYLFAHVRNIPGAPVPPPLPAAQPPFNNFPSPFGDGTVDMPFQFIPEAQAFLGGSPDGVIYVQGDSVFTGVDAVIALNDGETVLGEGDGDGVFQTLPVFGFTDEVTLPTVIPGGAVPELASAAGDAVTAASDNLFAGFNITNPTGDGIAIDSQTDGLFRDVLITDAVTDGVSMTGINTGTFRFDRVRIENAAGVGFRVDGGTAMVTLADPDNVTLGVPTISNMLNEAILIENTLGGFVNFAETIVDDNGGSGIRLIDNMGDVTLGLAMLDDTTMSADPLSVGAGIEIRGSSGNTTLLEDITITNAAGAGFLVADLDPLGRVSPSAGLTVASRNTIGVDFDNVDGVVQFSPTSNLVIGALGGAGIMDPAIRFYNGSSGTVILNDFGIADSLAEGILIGDTTGAMINDPGAIFRILGTGTINATTGPAINIRGAVGAQDPTNVDSQGLLTSNSRLGRGIHIEDTSGSISFPGATVINNNAVSGLSALFIDDITGSVGFGNFTANDNLGPEPAVDIQNVIDPAGVSFGSLNISNAIGTTGLEVTDTNRLTTNSGAIEVTGARAVDIENTNINVTLTSVDSTNSPDFGIRVVDSPGGFRIVGDQFTLGSGGTISGAVLAGAFFNNTDDVQLNFQDYTNNTIGILLTDMNDDVDDFFFLNQSRIMDNSGQGVFTTDVRNILIQESTFINNGTAAVAGAQQQILLNVLTNPNPNNLLPTDPNFESFVYVIQRNLFQDTRIVAGDDAVRIQTNGAVATDSRLELTVIDNLFQPFDRTDAVVGGVTSTPAALGVDWDGTLAADILRNTINMGIGGGQTGIRVATRGFDTRTDININDNLISAGDGGSADDLIGIDVDLSGPSNVTVARNSINFVTTPSIFDTSGNVGLRFRFIDGNNNVDIVNNRILMDEGAGIRVPIVVSPVGARSSFFIEGNQIGSLLQFPNQGIIFSSVTGTVLLNGNDPNIIFASNTIFFIPPGSSIGSIPIN